MGLIVIVVVLNSHAKSNSKTKQSQIHPITPKTQQTTAQMFQKEVHFLKATKTQTIAAIIKKIGTKREQKMTYQP